MLEKNWEIDMVGILATDEYVEQQKGYGRPVYINGQGQLQYLIKLISEPPQNFPKVNLFTGYISNITQYGFEEQLNLDEDTRELNFRNKINDYFFIFNVVQKGNYYNIDNVKLKKKIDAFDSNKDNLFISVPFFKKQEEEDKIDDFLDKIIKKKYLGKIENISTDKDDTPQYIIWGKDEFSDLYAVGIFDNQKYAYGGFQFQYKELKYIKITREMLEYSFVNPDNKQILFIENNTYSSILNELKAKEQYNPELQSDKQNKEKITNDISNLNRCEDENIFTDENLIDKFLSITKKNKFFYDKDDIVNFHTAMKVSNLVILSGMSGIGKSKLVYFYAKSLGIANDTQFKVIPVRPSWNDDSDLLGYVDSMHMVYKPGDCGLIDVLVEASKNSNKLYIVCFDEMNLARVEHYFSQFLSVLEMESDKRILKLYSEEFKDRLYNSSKYPNNIKIGDNVMFVGTLNVDESTYHFSDKVLDRANVINLKMKDDFLYYKKITQDNVDDFAEGDSISWTYEKYNKIKINDSKIDLDDNELLFLKEIHRKLNNVNKNIGIGYRILKQMDLYIKNLPKNLSKENAISRGKAMDIQLVQRVLTKVRGAEEQLEDLLDEKSENSLFFVFNKYKNISDFKESREVLEQKREELNKYGYAL